MVMARSRLLLREAIWKSLRNSLLSEGSQTQKSAYHIRFLRQNWRHKSQITGKQQYRTSEVMKIFCLDWETGYMTVYT